MIYNLPLFFFPFENVWWGGGGGPPCTITPFYSAKLCILVQCGMNVDIVFQNVYSPEHVSFDKLSVTIVDLHRSISCVKN